MSAHPAPTSKEKSASPADFGATLPHRRLLIALMGLLVVSVVLDRIAWASVAVWREDPATTIWLGYTRSIWDTPLGLISSMGVPNPNGLVLIAALLSRLPNLLVVSAVLGLIQAGLLAWVSWLGTRDLRLALLAAGPMLASITLRGASVELWGLWTSIPVNFLFMAGLLLYIQGRNPWALPLAVLALLLAPSFYFSGLANSIAFLILAVVVGLRWRPRLETRAWLVPVTVTFAILVLSVWLTWLPYFLHVSPAQLSDATATWSRTPYQRLLAASRSLFEFPLYSLDQFAGSKLYTIGQVEPPLLSSTTWAGYQWLLRETWIQALICYAALLAAVAAVAFRRVALRDVILPKHHLPAVTAVLAVACVMISYVIAPLLGGPAWAQGERLDQVTQFLPFLLLFWFLTPMLFEQPGRLQAALRRLTWINAVVYTVASMAVGLLVVHENLRYRGRELTTSDVPVYDKLRLVAFVAQDWRAHSSSTELPIDYDLGGGRWDWITDFGSSYLDWYPAPYTIGRAFDYEFLRGYGLHNSQEGIQERTFGNGRYLISYAFKPPPALPGQVTHDREIGRLRVTIRDEYPAP